jgi:hypothetical protein
VAVFLRHRLGPAGETAKTPQASKPSLTVNLCLQHVERWLAGATTNPSEATEKARMKMMLASGKWPAVFCLLTINNLSISRLALPSG